MLSASVADSVARHPACGSWVRAGLEKAAKGAAKGADKAKKASRAERFGTGTATATASSNGGGKRQVRSTWDTALGLHVLICLVYVCSPRERARVSTWPSCR